jgi:hypothetical protein
MSSEKEKLPGGWRSLVKQIHKGIQRDLGPRTPPESEMRNELRMKLPELDLMIYPKQTREYWSTELPDVMERIGELLRVEMPWSPWWLKILLDCARDLREQLHG